MNERIFYIEQHSEVSELINALKNSKADTILFVLPRGALLFESIVNLQILRSAAEELKKNIVLISNEKKAQTMSDTAGIESYTTLEEREDFIALNPLQKKEAATKRKKSSQFTPLSINGNTSEPSSEKEVVSRRIHWQEILARPSWQALIGLFLFSISLFIFLSFVAFPGATVAIRPEKKAVDVITNVTLYNAEKNAVPTQQMQRQNAILGFPIETVFEDSIEFSTITKVFEGGNAQGEITLFNLFPEPQRLRPSTRFQTENGLVFRIEDWVVVPEPTRNAEGELVPGSQRAAVVADEKDILGKFIGENGNIPASDFFLPGLPEASRQNLWAASSEAFSGGWTRWRPQVSEADIEAARNKITTDLLDRAQEYLQQFIEQKNARELLDLALLQEPEFLEKEVIDIFVEENILNTERESFRVSAKLKVRTWAYSEGALYDLLWRELSAKTSPQMELIDIAMDESVISLVEKQPQQNFLKVSIAIRGAEQFQIDPRSEAGILFVNALKKEIAGMKRKEAEAFLANKDQVSEVSISTWPFWSKEIPTLPENIAVKMQSDSAENE